MGPIVILDYVRENNLELMPHQYRALEYVQGHVASYLALDMGLGKTAIALALGLHSNANILVICPGYLRDNWKAEALKWGYDENEVQVILTRKAKLQYRKLTICSYDPETVKNILLYSIGYNYLILDEAHYLRGKKARRTKLITGSDARIKKFAALYAERIVYLSGTPMLNRPRELWPILRCTFPQDKTLEGYYQYAMRYCFGYDYQGAPDDSGACNLDELQELYLSKFMLQIKKEDVLDLPEKVYSTIDLPLNAEVKKLLKAEEQEELDVDYLISGKPAIGDYATMRRELGLLKIPYCREHIQDIVDQAGAVVVFTYHQELAKRLAAEFNTEPVIGSTPNKVRTRLVSDFQLSGGVFVGSYGAAGTGITLTKASHVVLCELEYSPRLIDQAVDRCHRIGQSNTVNIYTLLWSKGLERNLWRQLQEKDETFQNLFNRS